MCASSSWLPSRGTNASCESLLRFRRGAVLVPPSESFRCLRRGLRIEAPLRARCSEAMLSGAGEVDMLAHLQCVVASIGNRSLSDAIGRAWLVMGVWMFFCDPSTT